MSSRLANRAPPPSEGLFATPCCGRALVSGVNKFGDERVLTIGGEWRCPRCNRRWVVIPARFLRKQLPWMEEEIQKRSFQLTPEEVADTPPAWRTCVNCIDPKKVMDGEIVKECSTGGSGFGLEPRWCTGFYDGVHELKPASGLLDEDDAPDAGMAEVHEAAEELRSVHLGILAQWLEKGDPKHSSLWFIERAGEMAKNYILEKHGIKVAGTRLKCGQCALYVQRRCVLTKNENKPDELCSVMNGTGYACSPVQDTFSLGGLVEAIANVVENPNKKPVPSVRWFKVLECAAGIKDHIGLVGKFAGSENGTIDVLLPEGSSSMYCQATKAEEVPAPDAPVVETVEKPSSPQQGQRPRSKDGLLPERDDGPGHGKAGGQPSNTVFLTPPVGGMTVSLTADEIGAIRYVAETAFDWDQPSEETLENGSEQDKEVERDKAERLKLLESVYLKLGRGELPASGVANVANARTLVIHSGTQAPAEHYVERVRGVVEALVAKKEPFTISVVPTGKEKDPAKLNTEAK